MSPGYIKLLLEYNRYRKYETLLNSHNDRMKMIEETFQRYDEIRTSEERKITKLEENNRLQKENQRMLKEIKQKVR